MAVHQTLFHGKMKTLMEYKIILINVQISEKLTINSKMKMVVLTQSLEVERVELLILMVMVLLTLKIYVQINQKHSMVF